MNGTGEKISVGLPTEPGLFEGALDLLQRADVPLQGIFGRRAEALGFDRAMRVFSAPGAWRAEAGVLKARYFKSETVIRRVASGSLDLGIASAGSVKQMGLPVETLGQLKMGDDVMLLITAPAVYHTDLVAGIDGATGFRPLLVSRILRAKNEK